MKKFITLLLGLIIVFATNAQIAEISVVMGPDYANDVYYSLENDDVTSVSRKNWDIAFWTDPMMVGIYTNGGAGVDLYYMPGLDTTDWSTFDTSGLYMLEARYNVRKTWGDSGAFNVKTTGNDFSYGWGVYNVISHKIVGNVLYTIKLQDGSYKKIWIVEKDAPNNSYTFKYADIDGTNEETVVLNVKPHTSKNFIYYSLANKQMVDREPVSTSWQLLFSKYVDKVEFSGATVDYPVAGVLSNDEVYIAEVSGVNQVDYKNYKAHTFDSIYTNIIGSDWKVAMGMPPVYKIDNSLVYFIATQEGEVWKIYFTDFESGTVGHAKFIFVKENVTGFSSVHNENGLNILSVYPNPASGNNISVVYRMAEQDAMLRVYNMNGQQLHAQPLLQTDELNVTRLNTDLDAGMYIIRIESASAMLTQKLIVK